MPQTYEAYPMVLNGIFIGMISLRSDQKKYFDIAEPTADEQKLTAYLGDIKAHKRNIHTERLDSTTPTRQKAIDKKTNIERHRGKTVNSRGGKSIKVPTELVSVPAKTSTAVDAPDRVGSIRFTTMKFPGAASNAEISRWLHTKTGTTHRPKYFKTPAGRSFPVSAGLTAAVTAPETP